MIRWKQRPYYENLLTHCLWILLNSKNKRIKLFGLSGKDKGVKRITNKEIFANEFKKVEGKEIERFFEKQ